jgi:hypothetical protein
MAAIKLTGKSIGDAEDPAEAGRGPCLLAMAAPVTVKDEEAFGKDAAWAIEH